MKIVFDKEYMKKIKYITLGFVIIYIIYEVIKNFSKVVQGIESSLLWILGVLSPLIWGCIIAFILLPMVKTFEKLLSKVRLKKHKHIQLTKKGMKRRRLISLIASFIVVILILFIMVYGTYIMIGGTLKDFSLDETWKNIKINAEQYSTIFSNIESKLQELGVSSEYAKTLEGLSSKISQSINGFIGALAQRAGNIGRGIINFFFGFVFAANIIIYREYFAGLFENFLRLTLNEKRKDTLKEILHEIYDVFLGFIRGQIIDLTLLGLVTSATLMVAGFEFPFMVGMIAGYTNIVPYLGSWLGAVPVIFVSLAHGGLQRGIFGYIYILVVQQIYITFVTPKIQGNNVGIHPMFVLLSLTVFGSWFGLVGMILAIPLAGIIRVFIIRWVNYKKHKKKIELVDVNCKE